ncbi:MAG: DUF481 domain-containing protein [Pseudomonadota bacterium]
MKPQLLAAIALALATPSFAQEEEEENKGWTGEGSLGAGITTGNTDTVDLAVGLKGTKETELWKYTAEAGYDFGEVEGDTSRNRWFVAGQVDRTFSERFYGFSRITYEQDDFSGFDTRLFAGVGAGYHIFKRERLRWTIEAAPGYRRDEVADTLDLGPPPTIIEGGIENNFALRGSSAFGYDFNENVTFTNDTSVVWTDLSTQTINTTAINAGLTDSITARISFEVRNDTNPPDGFVNTDTATRLSIVYGF